MKAILLPLLLLLSFNVLAQENTVLTMNPTKDVMKEFMRSMYRFKNFRMGYLVMKDSSFATIKMNYHRFSDEIHFVNEKGDTLAIKEPKEVLFVTMARDTFFYHNKGFIQKVTNYQKVNLAVKPIFQYIGKDQKGAYGSFNAVASIDNLSNFSMDNQRATSFTEDANYRFRQRNFFYFIDNKGNFLQAKKSVLFDLLPADHTALEKFIEENKIDFEKEDHLLQLMWFVQSL